MNYDTPPGKDSGLTVEKIMEAKRILDAQPKIEPFVWVGTWKQLRATGLSNAQIRAAIKAGCLTMVRPVQLPTR